MKTPNQMKQEIVTVFTNNLTERKIPYFLGGSQRFGWNTPQSDFDLFALMLHIDIFYHPFVVLPHTAILSGDIYTNNNPQYTFLGGLIHFTIFESDLPNKITDFENLREEHIKIEKLLKENKKISQFAFQLKKEANLKGAQVYRAIKTLL